MRPSSITSSPVKFMCRTMITVRILQEVFLVVILRIVPFAERFDSRDNLFVFRVEVFLLHLVSDAFGSFELFVVGVEDGGAIF